MKKKLTPITCDCCRKRIVKGRPIYRERGLTYMCCSAECLLYSMTTFYAAGIGDVSELKKHRVVVEKSLIPEDDNAYVLPNIPPTVKQLYSGEEVEQIVKEREEYKHRAEVAERALQKFAEYITCEDCPFFSDCASPEKMGYPIHSYHCFSEYLKQAEKELAEEEKE